MRTRKNGLLIQFSIVFVIFLMITLSICALNIYSSQRKIYDTQFEKNARNIAEYLEDVLLSDSEEFLIYQKYIIEHREDIKIPVNFKSYLEAKC